MYGCAVPLAVAEPIIELGEAMVEDVAPEAVTSEAVVAPLSLLLLLLTPLSLLLLGPLIREARVRVKLQLWRSRGLLYFPLLLVLVSDFILIRQYFFCEWSLFLR